MKPQIPGRRMAPRRQFVKWVTFGMASSILGGRLWQRELLAYCEPVDGQPNGVFKVRLSDYPELSQPFGSVRLGLNPVDSFPEGNFYPILINRDDAGNFHVLDCECRHQSCVVPPFSMSSFNIECPCHGSQYWIDGSVLQGPTTMALGAYPFEFDGNDHLTIHIPCWAFSVSARIASGGAAARLQIDFYANPNTTYEVSFRQRTTDPWSIASFATTPSGPANQTSLLGSDSNVSVYVPRPTPAGFYAVGMKLGEV